jgi:hypothetical protein
VFKESLAMSWHTSAILIKADQLPGPAFLLGRLGFPGATEVGPIDFDSATSVEVLGDLEGGLGAAVAAVDGWVSIWGPFLVADPDAVAHLSSGGAALTLMLEGASGTAGFEWFRDGTLRRRWLAQAGDVIHDEGDPLPEEEDAPDDDHEGRVLYLLDRLALPLGSLGDVEYTLFRLPD